MISVERFGALHLSDYFSREHIGRDEGWELWDRIWIADGVGFTTFLVLPEEPDVTRCIEVAMGDIPTEVAKRLLTDLDIGLAPGMGLESVQSVLGTPVSEQRFVEDRVTHEYQKGVWTISTTVHERKGLIFLTRSREK